jgi:hypothetical protein
MFTAWYRCHGTAWPGYQSAHLPLWRAMLHAVVCRGTSLWLLASCLVLGTGKVRSAVLRMVALLAGTCDCSPGVCWPAQPSCALPTYPPFLQDTLLAVPCVKEEEGEVGKKRKRQNNTGVSGQVSPQTAASKVSCRCAAPA